MEEIKIFKSRVTSGLFWTSLSFGAWKLISMVSIFVLARLLSPHDFGLVGIAVVVIGVIRMFQDMGVGCALIYHKDTTPELTSTAFYMILASGFIFTLIGFFSAGYAASYFNNPGAAPVLKVLSLNIMVVSIGTVPGFLLTKELQFKKRVGPEMAAALVQAVVSVFLALSGFGVWSLVIGDIANRTVASAGAWIVHPWRPKLLFDFRLARELFNYSKFMVGSSISSFATSNADNIIIARMVGTTSLGYYTLAFRVASLPSTLTFFILSKVTFPVFSKLQDDRKRLASAFLRTVKYLTFASLPLGIAMYMLAPEFVSVLLGQKWDDSVAPLRALIVYGIFASVIWQTIEVYKATGRTDVSFGSETIRLLILIPLAIVGALFGGIYGVAIAQSITVAVASIFYFYPLIRMLEIEARDLFGALFPSLIPSACIGLSIWLVGGAFQQHPILQASRFLKLIASSIIASLIFLAFIIAFARNRVWRTVSQFSPNSIGVELAPAQAYPAEFAPVKTDADADTRHDSQYENLSR
jgi:O-antigen/teichoic acid export membrane protein